MGNNDRVLFSDNKDFIDIPNLIGHQLESFHKFIDEYIGVELEQIFPIQDKVVDTSYQLDCVGYRVEPPNITVKEAKEKDKTYAGHLYLKLRLTDNLMGGSIKESEVFFGEIPFMTNTGSFIMNGNERVVVTQMVKSPGAYFEYWYNDRGKKMYKTKIQPERGSWLIIESNAREEVTISIDGGRKIPVTLFLKSLGFKDNDEILDYFGHDNRFLLASLAKDDTTTQEEAIMEFYKRSRPGEPQIMEKAKGLLDYIFRDPKRYDLDNVGRFKLNQRLGLRHRVLKKRLAENIGSYKIGDEINDELVDMLEDSGVNQISVIGQEGEVVEIKANIKTDSSVLENEDILACINYMLNLDNGFGVQDDVDHLSNRYLKMVGKILQKEFLIGMKRVEKNIKSRLNTSSGGYRRNKEELTPGALAFPRPLEAKFREFLGASQLSQYVDQINPLSEVTNKRRATAIGPGGLSKDRASVEARDVHTSHYGRICPVETPEGSSVGLINQISLFSGVNEYGFLTSPYRKVKNGVATDEVVYLTADIEESYFLAESSSLNEDGTFGIDEVLVKHGEDYLHIDKMNVDYVGVSTKQPLGIGASCIPFLENDDASRVLMGANMLRQGLPSLTPEEPVVGTGLEKVIARDTGASVVAKEDGTVKGITNNVVSIEYKTLGERRYEASKFERTNASTCWSHFIKCHVGQKVSKGEILIDSTSSKNGELAVGQNLLVAMLPMEGYNFEDSIVISDRLAKEDRFSTIMIEEYKIDVRKTRTGLEEVTRDIPNVGEVQKRHLDEYGVVEVGSYVKGGDILVGKKTPRAKEEKSPEDRLIESLFVGKVGDYRNNSLTVEYGKPERIVIDVIRNTNKDSDTKKGVVEEIKVYVAEKRKISEGDKMAGRHGNKGVVSIVLPEEDMPYLEDGTPVDIVLNPLGVPSRMNLGQVMEAHLGMVARELGVKFEVPIFSGINSKERIQDLMIESGLPEDGKFKLWDGRTGEEFENEVMVGVMYMLKLDHQISDKMHARSTGPYSLVTQQPLGGKAQNGGQRFGEMEVWAMEAYGAANALQEMLTLKSDDFMGRSKMFKSLVRGQSLPEPSLTESLKLVLNEMRALGLDTDIVTSDGKELMKPPYKPKKVKGKDREEESLSDDEIEEE